KRIPFRRTATKSARSHCVTRVSERARRRAWEHESGACSAALTGAPEFAMRIITNKKPLARAETKGCLQCERAAGGGGRDTQQTRRGGESGRALGAARDDELSGSHHLDEPIAFRELLERVELFGAAGDLDDHRRFGDIDDVPFEDLGHLEDVRSRVRADLDLEESELSFDRLLRHVLLGPHGVDELVELLDDLIESGGLALARDRHPRETGPVPAAHHERVDVE